MGKHHFLPARAKGAAAVATIVGLTGVGVAFSTEPSAGAASARRVVSPKAPPARVPLDAAVAARARAQAEQTMRDFQAAQEAQARAAYLAAVAEYYRPKTGVNWDGIAQVRDRRQLVDAAARASPVGSGSTTARGAASAAASSRRTPVRPSREQQIVVAERVYARYGLCGWGCRAYG